MTAEVSRDLLGDDSRPRNGRSSLLAIRALHVVLWLLVFLGPVAAAVVVARLADLDSRLDTIQTAVGATEPTSSSGAEGFAELFIAAFLAAGEDTADALDAFINDVSLEGIESGSWSPVRTTTLGAEEIADGYYAVMIAVDVASGEENPQTRFYSVGVVDTGSGWVVPGLPALVSAPTGSDPPELTMNRLDDINSRPGLEDMLIRFLPAFLAGEGELARYTSPSSPIAPVEPSVFTDIEIVKSGVVSSSDGGQRVSVMVRATDTGGRAQLLEYWLAVDQRDGRWEVAEVLPAPPLAVGASASDRTQGKESN